MKGLLLIGLVFLTATVEAADEPKLKIFVTPHQEELAPGTLTSSSKELLTQVNDLKKRLDNIFDLASTRGEADIVVVVSEPTVTTTKSNRTVITTLSHTTIIGEGVTFARFWCHAILYVPKKNYEIDVSDDGMISIWNASNATFKKIRDWYNQNKTNLRVVQVQP